MEMEWNSSSRCSSNSSSGLISGKSDAFDLHTKQITRFNGFPQLKNKALCGLPLALPLRLSPSLANAFPFEPEPKSNLFGHSDGHKIFVAWARLGIY